MKTLLVLLGLLIAAPAFALNDWGYGSCDSGAQVGTSGCIAFDFDSTLATTLVGFSVKGNGGLACLNLSVTACTSADATVYFCSYGTISATGHCIEMAPAGGNPLTGAGGTPAAQRACVEVGPGQHVVDLTAPAANTCVFTVEGR